MSESCGNCWYYGMSMNVCRRRSPVPHQEPGQLMGAAWPRVHSGQWCGEWRPIGFDAAPALTVATDDAVEATKRNIASAGESVGMYIPDPHNPLSLPGAALLAWNMAMRIKELEARKK